MTDEEFARRIAMQEELPKDVWETNPILNHIAWKLTAHYFPMRYRKQTTTEREAQ
jgi:hypothetical protein